MRFAQLGVKIEARNQARVHLWYPRKHGLPYPALQSSTQGIDRFLTKTTQVGIRRNHDGHDVYAPNGFDDIADMIVRPNPGPEFLGGELRGEGAALENAVAGTHGAGCRRRHDAVIVAQRATTNCYRARTAPRRR